MLANCNAMQLTEGWAPVMKYIYTEKVSVILYSAFSGVGETFKNTINPYLCVYYLLYTLNFGTTLQW